MASVDKIKVGSTSYNISPAKDGTLTGFTSNDAASPTAWSAADAITTSDSNATIFSKITTMIKNVRWLYSKLGTTDFSATGQSTVTGALSALQSGLNGKAASSHSHTTAQLPVSSSQTNSNSYIPTSALVYSMQQQITSLNDATNSLKIATPIGVDANLFTLAHGLYFAQGDVSTDNNWPFTGYFMGLIEKRGTTDGTGSNYHCVITLWNEIDAKEYNNIYAYSAWSGWKITSTNIEYNELKTSVSNGKSAVASAITDKGISTSATAEFSTMASNIRAISTGIDTSDATATAAQILSGYTAYAKGVKLTGTASAGYTSVSSKSASLEYTSREFTPLDVQVDSCTMSNDTITANLTVYGRLASEGAGIKLTIKLR